MAPADLERARRVRDNLAELRALLRVPALAERASEALDLARLLNPAEADMAHDKAVTFRLPDDVIERLDGLGERMARNPTLHALAGGVLSRSQVLRVAVTRGLEVLEAEHPADDK